MTVYVDSSVVVRIVVRQPEAITDLGAFEEAVASVLVEIEVPRAIQSLRTSRVLGEESAVVAAADAREMLRRLELIEMDAPLRLRAAGPLGSPLRSLDAIHLASALCWRDEHPDEELMFATHDERLARAAQANGLRVVGWP